MIAKFINSGFTGVIIVYYKLNFIKIIAIDLEYTCVFSIYVLIVATSWYKSHYQITALTPVF